MSNTQKPTVFYDGACPLCQREIAFYRRREGADAVCWIDVSETDQEEVVPGLSKDRALGRFHVISGDGKLVSGGPAFAELWAALPGFRPVGRILRTQPFAWILDRAYGAFLVVRPRLQAMASSRQVK